MQLKELTDIQLINRIRIIEIQINRISTHENIEKYPLMLENLGDLYIKRYICLKELSLRKEGS